MTDALRCEAPIGDRTGEAATWDHIAQLLYWCDINRFLIHRFDPATGAVHSWHFAEPVTALSLTTDPATLLVALGSSVILWSPRTDARSNPLFVLPGAPAQRFNDGRAGPDGAFWISSMANNVGPEGEDLKLRKGEGTLFRITSTDEPTIHATSMDVPNTLCWSPDETHFYFADSGRNMIWRYEYDAASHTLGSRTPHLAGFDRGVPDGSAIDADGYLWNCRYDGRCIVRIAPDGRIDRIVDIPSQHVASCAFGGPDLHTLFITTAGMNNSADRLAGSLFSLRTETPGLPGYLYKTNSA